MYIVVIRANKHISQHTSISLSDKLHLEHVPKHSSRLDQGKQKKHRVLKPQTNLDNPNRMQSSCFQTPNADSPNIYIFIYLRGARFSLPSSQRHLHNFSPTRLAEPEFLTLGFCPFVFYLLQVGQQCFSLHARHVPTTDKRVFICVLLSHVWISLSRGNMCPSNWLSMLLTGLVPAFLLPLLRSSRSKYWRTDTKLFDLRILLSRSISTVTEYYIVLQDLCELSLSELHGALLGSTKKLCGTMPSSAGDSVTCPNDRQW